MQKLITEVLKIKLIYEDEIKEFFCEYFFLKIEKYEYSFFFNHKSSILPLKKSEVIFYKDKDETKKIYILSGLFTFNKNCGTFFIENK